MTISLTGPVSLHAIRDSFEKSDRIAADERYVRDFNQFEDDEGWDLEAYRGQAFGLQYQISNDGWTGGSFAGDLPLDEVDKRVDGAYDGLDTLPGGENTTYAFVDKDDRGSYAELSLFQTFGRSDPGAVSLNGRFYATETGTYRLRATVETLAGFSEIGQAGIFVFGYRYGYLDGDRVPYALWGKDVNPGPNQTLTCNQTFTVDEAHRHIVVNPNVLITGRWEPDWASMKVRDLTIEKV